ncbi:AAA family ATPase [Roseovarius sp. SCSIO 43702]|uniref:AAA family ATPase n=1 Tax=Roseovarius sp. SCSIO 43702 TaxID=2823043 RepID=UPI001C7354AD|nr:AAA family ATPase [Roseovarius sp. SCSIO 43702]QYX57975.1 AAA family ATPase [Roseovarius sp. SCSIO 43702]
MRVSTLRISRIEIKNWRNFRGARVSNVSDIVYLLGPNAAGKSNFLDVMRFLRDLAKSKGGGLQEAVESRGGISKIRCLHARKDTEVLIDIDVTEGDGLAGWNYIIGFNIPSAGFEKSRRPIITREIVNRIGIDGEKTNLLNRPNAEDDADDAQRQQTYLEQVNTNKKFRELADFFGSITYYHLVPQLLKFGDEISGRILDDDPFGQGFLLRVSSTPERQRNSRLRKIEKALQSIVPQLEDLKFIQDEITGRPHLEIRFKHHRPQGAKQREDQFSDGTLRLIALFWLLQEAGDAPLLLEEPELSLNEEVVRQLSYLIETVRRRKSSSSGRQVLISTHSYALLSNPGIDADGIIVIEPSDNGSTTRKVNKSEQAALSAGLSPAEVVLPHARSLGIGMQLKLDL